MNSDERNCIIEDIRLCVYNVNFALRFEKDAKYRDILCRVRRDLFTLFNHYQSLHIESIQDTYNDFSNSIKDYE